MPARFERHLSIPVRLFQPFQKILGRPRTYLSDETSVGLRVVVGRQTNPQKLSYFQGLFHAIVNAGFVVLISIGIKGFQGVPHGLLEFSNKVAKRPQSPSSLACHLTLTVLVRPSAQAPEIQLEFGRPRLPFSST